MYLPLPSDYAKNWSQYQTGAEARILCLRPPEARGLPLCTLHDVFRRFLLAAREPLPQASDTTIAAIRAAALLCSSMGQSFSTKGNDSNSVKLSQDTKENARTIEFDDCTGGILDRFDKTYTLNTSRNVHTGIVDGALLEKDVLIAIREIKAEPGAAGDAYMQVARGYDLALRVLQDRIGAKAFLKQGAPMFLLCVVGARSLRNSVYIGADHTCLYAGPQLLIAGGFYDGNKVTVEPLGDICLMLEDYTNARCKKLAQVLYALAKGIGELKK